MIFAINHSFDCVFKILSLYCLFFSDFSQSQYFVLQLSYALNCISDMQWPQMTTFQLSNSFYVLVTKYLLQY